MPRRCGARAAEVLTLARTIQEVIYSCFDIRFEPEAVIV